MKHPSIWLTALLLGGAPLCAMAFDYGSSAPLLAADASAQQLPLASADDAARNDTARSVVADAEPGGDGATEPTESDAAPEPRHVAPAAGSMKPAAVRGAPPAVSRKGHPDPDPDAHPAPSTATGTSWQSLLPGSIQ